jgi:hypothetical protein
MYSRYIEEHHDCTSWEDVTEMIFESILKVGVGFTSTEIQKELLSRGKQLFQEP